MKTYCHASAGRVLDHDASNANGAAVQVKDIAEIVAERMI